MNLDRLAHELAARTDRIVSAQVIARTIVDARKSENMTAKVQGAPTRFDRLISNAEAAIDKVFTRLEKATEQTHENVRTIEGVAVTVEKSNQVMADRLNQLTNGGPPLDEAETAPAAPSPPPAAP